MQCAFCTITYDLFTPSEKQRGSGGGFTHALVHACACFARLKHDVFEKESSEGHWEKRWLFLAVLEKGFTHTVWDPRACFARQNTMFLNEKIGGV